MIGLPGKGALKKPTASPGKTIKKPPDTNAAKPTPIKRNIFADEIGNLDTIQNEEVEAAHHQRQLSIVFSQSIVVIILVVLLVLLAPFLQPVYHYYARDPDGNLITLDALVMPNMTNQAVVSWAVTSVTEIMTFGFGDVVNQMALQKPRFTDTGWKSFLAAFSRQGTISIFRQNQLVLTTVPYDTAVIVNQGPDRNGVYFWRVQVPVILTFATNNNVTTHRRSVITLTIERVKEEQNPAGIAIKTWLVQ